MIYFCIPARNEASTIGLVLWKIRQTLEESRREYQLLVGDDASDDSTAEVLEPYGRTLPLITLRSEQPIGYAATVERLLREALERSDRHKRDVALIWPADYTVGMEAIGEFLKRLDSGADLVIGEATVTGEEGRGRRLVRRWASRILGSKTRVPGVSDVVSGVAAIRLVALRQAFRDRPDQWLTTEGWAANAELVSWVAAAARQTESVAITIHADRRQRPSRIEPWPLARSLWQARRRLRRPPVTRERALHQNPRGKEAA
ncbi:MAG TPA: glycosyltransferase [Gemmatimonadales bacterium]|nr:glycosyltransferase [Gemmatimonadales bacterium]